MAKTKASTSPQSIEELSSESEQQIPIFPCDEDEEEKEEEEWMNEWMGWK